MTNPKYLITTTELVECEQHLIDARQASIDLFHARVNLNHSNYWGTIGVNARVLRNSLDVLIEKCDTIHIQRRQQLEK